MPYRNQKIFDEGWQAWTDGAHMAESPYQSGTEEHDAWLDGWNAAWEDREWQDAQLDNDPAADRGDFECHQMRDE